MSEANSERQNDPKEPSSMVAGPSGGAAATEHIASLPAMSLTAGLGSGDYVAISTAAIIALLLGFGSLLAFIDSTLLVIPLAGIVMAFVAMRNIRRGGGTLTGRGMAISGLVLSVAIGSINGAMVVKSTLDEREASRQIDQVCIQFGQYMKAHDYDAMYDMLSNRFKSRLTRQEFVEKMRSIQDELAAGYGGGKGAGEIVAMRGDGPLFLSIEPGSNVETGITAVKLIFQNPRTAVEEQEIKMRLTLDHWQIDDLPELFPPPAQPGQ